MALMNLLRDIPNKVVQMMMDKGYARVLSDEERIKMAEDVNAFTEEMFGEKAVKEKKAKPQVVNAPPAKITREYLMTLTVTQLKNLGKDCAALKGRKPRDQIIEILLQNLDGAPSPVPAAAPSPVVAVTIASSPVVAAKPVEDGSSSEDELKSEPIPPFTAVAAAEAKKKRATKPKEPKEPKEPKAAKEKKAKPAAAAEPEEEEDVLTVKEWYHPNELHKPKEERTKYYIDPATNLIYDPEDTSDPMGQWDEATSEIVPVKE